MRIGKFIFLIFLAGSIKSLGQDDRSWSLNGYVKDLVTINVPEEEDSVLIDNLVHNRLNFSWSPTAKFTTRLDLRTRIFTGDVVNAFPDYGALIDVNNDYFDLSAMPVNEDKIVIHTMLDRAYVEWTESDWQLRIGRQRINWGVNLVWNPNDIFNAYSFFDFDYEERPGSDAIRFQKFIGYAGGYEIAVKMADSLEAITAAGLYKWNKANYDFQLMTGIMKDHLVFGGGWAGNIDISGFKGEFTILQSLESNAPAELLSSISVDHSFANSLYLNGSILYNSTGSDDPSALFLQSTANLDIRSLSPYKWSTFFQSSYLFHPLVSGGISTLYFPGQEGVFLNPFVTYSMKPNLDFDLIGQFFVQGEPTSVTLIFTRMKLSF